MLLSVANYSFAQTSAIPGISCDTVRCGTSRVIVLLGEQLPDAEEQLGAFIYKMLMGDEFAADGLKGDHYQSNKVAVVYPGNWRSQVRFIFFQLDPKTRRVVANMECANLSVGAGMIALLKGICLPDEHGSMYAYNLGTGQNIELVPHDPQRVWSCNWTVRFLQGVSLESFYSQVHYEPLPVPGYENFESWIIENGNVFVFVNAHPDVGDDAEIVDAISEAGRERALRLGLDPVKASMPKIIFYSTGEANFNSPTVEACCFFKSEKHKSLPGSGSMCLATFLTASLLRDQGAPSHFGSVVFTIKHPGGSLDVAVSWATINNEIIINSAGFITPAKLLLHGSFTL